MRKSEDLYTPAELLKKYPDSPFTDSDLGRLLRFNLLSGCIYYKKALIKEQSFLDLINFRNQIITSSVLVLKK